MIIRTKDLVFCPVCCGAIPQALQPIEAVAYSRLDIVCPYCRHHIMIHDFGRA